MKSKDWDSYLQSILGDFEPKGDPSWEDLTSKLGDTPIDTDSSSIPGDEALKNSLAAYKPTGAVQGWEELSSSLDKADAEFDNEVEDKIKHYNAPYDPNAWSLFLKHFSTYKALRLKLIALKVFEASAVLLLVFTVFQMNQKGSFPMFGKQKNIEANSTQSAISQDQYLAEQTLNTSNKNTLVSNEEEGQLLQTSTTNNTGEYAAIGSYSDNNLTRNKESGLRTTSNASSIPTIPLNHLKRSSTSGLGSTPTFSGMDKIMVEPIVMSTNIQQDFITEPLALTNINLENQSASLIPFPIYVKPADKGHLEFGMLAQVDFNNLKMPQDILYTNRKQFVFPLQGVPSVGYGAGFTLGVAHEQWAFESGVIYSSKTFRPGRSLTIGKGSDNSSVVFDAMQIQLISIPIQFRYTMLKQNRFKLYAIAGFGMHIIAQSDIDVDVNYNFNSLPEGENPNNHPALAQTIRESQRLSDNFRHKAPFSTQSFVSANLGLGLEYAIAARKTLFLQTTYQYQIPNLRFSNHNGKQLVSTSIQAGVRTPLGL
jgi:hypothetical protein